MNIAVFAAGVETYTRIAGHVPLALYFLREQYLCCRIYSPLKKERASNMLLIISASQCRSQGLAARAGFSGPERAEQKHPVAAL